MKIYESFILASCRNPECGNVHMYLFDKVGDEEPAAVTGIAIEHIPEITKALQNAAYEFATTKDDQ